jgi:antitoxin component YwqK of YwqJK toxin-antitoxin module
MTSIIIGRHSLAPIIFPIRHGTAVPTTDRVTRDFYGGQRLEYHVIKGTEIKHGRYTDWYPNGQRQCEIMYVYGQRHGLCTTWYPNGQMAVQETYVNGKKHVYTSWHPNGRVCDVISIT